MGGTITMRIGELVKANIGNIFRYCENEPAELARLMSAEYTRMRFGLAWPFCTDTDKIAARDHCRYWTTQYVVADRRVRVCSQWFDKQQEAFSNYLVAKQIAPAPAIRPNSEFPPRHASILRRPNGRYGGTQIGDAQNAFVRVILSRLGNEAFDYGDWERTKAYFDHRCAYCDQSTVEHRDHAVPINRSKLGEHRLGNLVPACKQCNAAKHDRDYREYLGENMDRIARIEAYMVAKSYVPLGDNDQVKRILEQAHKEIAALAERYAEILNTILLPPSTEQIG
jgi:5-methylcytosine-specific restriction endonuclease McrA